MDDGHEGPRIVIDPHSGQPVWIDHCQTCGADEQSCACEHFLCHPSKLVEHAIEAGATSAQVVVVDPDNGTERVVHDTERTIN